MNDKNCNIMKHTKKTMTSIEDYNSAFVKPDMRKGCESESVRIAGAYLRMMLNSDLRSFILTGDSQKSHWKKNYLRFMRKKGWDVSHRHAYQVLYALSRHYEACVVDGNNITWTFQNEETADSKVTIGELRWEIHCVYGELRNSHNELARLKCESKGTPAKGRL